MSSRIEIDMGTIEARIKTIPPRLDQLIAITVANGAQKGQAMLKANAPWTDRTGMARTGLSSTYYRGTGQHTIVMAHAVHYGIWLEIKNSGEYQVIMPTVRETGRGVMKDLRGLLGKL